MYPLLADLVLVVHAAIVLFVVGGLVIVFVGNVRGWQWVNAIWFRFAHLLAIGVVTAQAWAGMVCPLTTLESWLRVQGGSDGYASGFIEHWVHRVIFYEAPTWVFTVIYTAFAAAVVLTWWRYPPKRARGAAGQRSLRP